MGGGLYATVPIYSSLLYGYERIRSFVIASVIGIIAGLLVLVASTLVVGYGNYLGSQGGP